MAVNKKGKGNDTQANDQEKQKAKEARKAKNQKNWKETMSVLDATQTALNNYPELNDIGLDINFNYLGNPFIYLFTVIKHTKGADYIYKIIGGLITPLCYALEYSVKAVFMARLTELLSCTLSNLRINEDLINNGFTINLKDVDLLNMLAYSPLSNENTSSVEFFKVKKKDKNKNVMLDDEGNPIMESKSVGPSNIGRYYYFGCDKFDKADDVIFSPDFNAVIWYVKNRANKRVVWYGSKYQNKDRSDVADNLQNNPSQTLSKRDGIVTLEYHDNGKSLRKANGSPYYLQSPSENCLHVFIGNTSELPKGHAYVAVDRKNKNEIKNANKLYSNYNKLIEKLEKKKERAQKVKKIADGVDNVFPGVLDKIPTEDEKEKIDIDIDIQNIDDYLSKLKAGNETVKQIFGGTANEGTLSFKSDALGFITFDTKLLNESRNSLNKKATEAKTNGTAIDLNSENTYRNPDQNYYYKKFLMTFNSDYIWSVKLFDPKVVAAQLIDALTGCVSVDLGLSVETQILKAEVENMVSEICNDDSYEVSDCFFTFTNDGYNALVEKAELAKMGLVVMNNDASTITKADVIDLLSGLDALGEQVDNKSQIISEAILKASRLVNGEERDTIEAGVDGEMSFSFLENLMNKLATVIVTSVVSPKLYIMLIINFQIMKLNTHFDIASFINHYKQILVAIIRDVRDQLIKMFTEIIMEIVKDLIKELTAVMAMEQIQYYKKLIESCMECVKIMMRSNDWTMAKVDYADIIPSSTEESQDNNNC